MFKTATLIVALGVTPVFATSIVEADQVSYEQKDSEHASGTVTNVDMDDKTFTIEMSDGEQKEITYGDRTAFLYDSDGSTAEEVLQHDMTVRVEHTDGLAELVILSSDQSAEDFERAWGMVTNIDEDDNTFTIETADGQGNRITWGDDTAFIVDGETHGADAALLHDKSVRVLHRDGLASYVICTSRDDGRDQ